jgi:hypothetical protein
VGVVLIRKNIFSSILFNIFQKDLKQQVHIGTWGKKDSKEWKKGRREEGKMERNKESKKTLY